jgi:hypothetical protein
MENKPMKSKETLTEEMITIGGKDKGVLRKLFSK